MPQSLAESFRKGIMERRSGPGSLLAGSRNQIATRWNRPAAIRCMECWSQDRRDVKSRLDVIPRSRTRLHLSNRIRHQTLKDSHANQRCRFRIATKSKNATRVVPDPPIQ